MRSFRPISLTLALVMLFFMLQLSEMAEGDRQLRQRPRRKTLQGDGEGGRRSRSSYRLPETIHHDLTGDSRRTHHDPHFIELRPPSHLDNTTSTDPHPHGRIEDPLLKHHVADSSQMGSGGVLLGSRFLLASADYGQTFNRIRNVLNLLEAAVLLNRTAVIPVAVAAKGRRGEIGLRFDDGLAQHVHHVPLSSFMATVAPLLRSEDVATTPKGAPYASKLGLPLRKRPTLPPLPPQNGIISSYGAVREPVVVLEPIVGPPAVGVHGGEWVALPHLHFDRAIEMLGRSLLRQLIPTRPFLAIHMRSMDNECNDRARKFNRPLEWCRPTEEQLRHQVQRVMQQHSIPPGNVFLASDGQRKAVDAMLVREFDAKVVPTKQVPDGSPVAVLVDAYIATLADAFIGSAFSSLSGFVRAHRVYNGRFPRSTNYPYANLGDPSGGEEDYA